MKIDLFLSKKTHFSIRFETTSYHQRGNESQVCKYLVNNKLCPFFFEMRWNWKIPIWDLATCIFITLYHFIVVIIMNTARSKHETIHTHAQMFSFSFQTFPNKHAGPWFSCNLSFLSRKRLNVFWNKKNHMVN